MPVTMLIDGEWDPDAELERSDDGEFKRQPTSFRERVSADPESAHPVEPDRYHLYVSYACPWAHRVLIGRSILGLEDVLSVDVVDPVRFDEGWVFSPEKAGCTADSIHGASHLRDIYLAADEDYTGRVTVPVLWDRAAETIVNNESIEILRQLDTAFVEALDRPTTLYPSAHAEEIDAVVDAIYEPINNGVYRAGFAQTQPAYDDAIDELFDALEYWNEVLGDQRYLVGDRLTEADVCLFTTLIRFDPVYHVHFKCSRRRIRDYHHLWNYLKELYQLPAIQRTVDLDHIRTHYFTSHGQINPTRIVATMPELPLDEPHDRDRLTGDPPAAALNLGTGSRSG